MTKPATLTVHYVIATFSSMGTQTIRLLGPFYTERAAWAMIRPVRFAVRKYLAPSDDRYAYCDVTTRTEAIPVGQRMPRGALDLATVVDQDWIDYVCG